MSLIKAEGGVCAPKGFVASGVVANIKSNNPEKRDVAIVFSEVEAVAAGVFTTNLVKAAPVVLSEEIVKKGILFALVINSGNANCCTSEQGMRDAKLMCSNTAEALGIDPEKVAVASTGVIGLPLPMEKVCDGIARAAPLLSSEGHSDAALAIMTTDTFAKEYAVVLSLAGVKVTIGGMAKGSGMVHPNMATILGFITTDAAITLEALQAILKRGADSSFNMISVDGDTSTNDMVLAMANGLAGQPLITMESPHFEPFAQAVEHVLVALAKMVARDGEGATKLLEVQVEGAATLADARKAARAVSSSPLVKTALFGSDANWGRILCALGYSGAEFDPNLVDLYIGSIPVMAKGAPIPFNEEEASALLAKLHVPIRALLHAGKENATAWGCDLSYEYIKINGEYRT